MAIIYLRRRIVNSSNAMWIRLIGVYLGSLVSCMIVVRVMTYTLEKGYLIRPSLVQVYPLQNYFTFAKLSFVMYFCVI